MTWVGTPGKDSVAIAGPRPWIDVGAYGAIFSDNDSDAAANDAAIAAAIAVIPATGATLYVPAPLVVGTKINFGTRSGVHLQGAGWRNSGIRLKNNVNDDLLLFGNGVTYTTGIRISGLLLNGNKTNQSAGTVIHTWSTEDVHLDNVYVLNGKDMGVHVEGTASRNNVYTYISNCYINGNAQGGVFFNGQAYAGFVWGNTLAGNAKTTGNGAIRSNANSEHLIYGNLLDDNEIGVRLYGSSWCTITGNSFINQEKYGILLDGGSDHHTVVGNIILDPSEVAADTYDGIRTDGTYNVISSNMIYGRLVTMSAGIREVTGADHNNVQGNTIQGATTPIVKVGASTMVRNNKGYVSENSGATSVADGGTINHGLATTPAKVRVTPTVAGEMASVTAVGATTFTVALKKHDGSAGTTAVVYWAAEI